MADFYDDLDLDIEGYDPDDPSDPINALLEKIREAQADKSPKAYVLNEKNLKRFMIVYKNVDLLVGILRQILETAILQSLWSSLS